MFWLIDYEKNAQYHPSCCGTQLDRIPMYRVYPSCSAEIKGMKQINEPMKSEIIKSLWSDYLNPNLQIKQNLYCNINSMKFGNLLKELKKRDISQYIDCDKGKDYSKQLYIKRLIDYYKENQKDIEQIVKLLTYGYCRQNESKYSLKIPMYLNEIINKYFPLLFHD